MDDRFRGDRQTYEWANILRLGGTADAALTFGVVHALEFDRQPTAGALPFQTTTNATRAQHDLQPRLPGALLRPARRAGRRRAGAGGGLRRLHRLAVGASLALPEINSRLIASAGTAFKAPSLYQRFGRIGTTFRGNPDLRRRKASAGSRHRGRHPRLRQRRLRHLRRDLVQDHLPQPDQLQRRPSPRSRTSTRRARRAPSCP